MGILNDFGGLLSGWGLSPQMLVIIGAILFTAFVFSVREYLCWFLKINTLLKKIDLLEEKVETLEKQKTTASVAPHSQFPIQTQLKVAASSDPTSKPLA